METAIISRGNQPTTNGRHYVIVPVPADMAGRLQRGFAILDGYPQLLSERGRQLAQQVDHFFANAEQLPAEQIQNQAQELASQLPSLQAPHLELFRSPDNALFKGFLKKKGRTTISLEMVFGCVNYCLFCSAEAPQKINFMPYPMLLAIAESVRELGQKIFISFHRGEPLHYQDALFGANLADVIRTVPDIHLGISCTHGWPNKHKYAQAAAEELYGMGKTFSLLSFHLFHKEFMGSEVPPATIKDFAQRFIRAITLLKPSEIGFRGFEKQRAADNPEQFSLSYALRFFIERVLPHLPPEQQEYYKGAQQLQAKSGFLGIKFSARDIRFVRNAYQGIFPGVRGLEGVGWGGKYLRRQDAARLLLGGDEMVVHIDGHYVLQELERNGHDGQSMSCQEGDLFS